VAHGFGANSEERRRPKRSMVFNRQVDIIVNYREKIPYRIRRPESKGSFLDFKGFLFRIPGHENE